jgi:Cu/Ag efflux pump CusA
VRSLVQSSLRSRLLVVGLATAVVVVGFTQLRDAPVDILPEFSATYVEIQTEALGLSAAEVEAFVTVPLEEHMLNGVAWVDEIRSQSLPGLSSIVLLFEPGTDLMRARQVVQERLNLARVLPRVSRSPQMLQPLSSSSRVMIVELMSTDVPLIDMSVLARWTIRPRLMGVPGVANVSIWGHRERQLQVQVDPARLQANQVTLDQVIATSGNALWVSPLTYLEASTPGSGGFIDTPNQRLGIQHLLPIRTPDDLARVPIEGAPNLRLGDVATVVQDHQPLIGDAATNNGRSLLLVVEKFPGTNTVEVTRDLEAALEAMKPGLGGIQIDSTVYRPASYIESAFGNISLAALFGAALIVLVLALFLLDWRRVVVSAAAIAVSIIAAALVLSATGATLNTLTLAGLLVALTVMVDDAVADVENAGRRLDQNGSRARMSPAAQVAASLQTRGPLAYATVVILIAIVPLLALDGVAGSFLRPLAIAYVSAVTVSFFVALTLTPALSHLLLRRRPGGRRSPLAGPLEGGHERGLQRVTARPALAYAALAALVVVGILALPLLTTSPVPTFRERDLLIRAQAQAGTSLQEMNRVAALAADELRGLQGIRGVGSHAGRAVMSDRIANVNVADLWVSIDPAADYDGTVAAIEDVIAGYPGLRFDVESYLDARSAEALKGDDGSLTVRLYGPLQDQLEAKAEEVRNVLSSVPGITSAAVDAVREEPQVEIEVDLAAAAEQGMRPGDIRRAAAALVSGIEVGNLFEDQKVFEVVVWGAPSVRSSVARVRELQLGTPDGRPVRLDEVADVRIVPAPTVIKREGISRHLDVVAQVNGRDRDAVLTDVRASLGPIQFPRGYHAEVVGGGPGAGSTLLSLALTVAGALVAMLLLLHAALSSWRLAAVAVFAIAASLAGGAVGALVGGRVLSFGSLLGFLAVFALAVRHVVALMSHYRDLEPTPGRGRDPGLVVQGARDRLLPVVTSVLASAAAVLAFWIVGDVAGLELAHDMAVVVLGGLVTAALVSLFVVPAAYLHLGVSGSEDAIDLAVDHPEPQPMGAR